MFSSVGDDLTVYARLRDRDGTLRGILVHDARERGAPVTILAEAGRITPTPTGPRVTLENGERQQVERVPAAGRRAARHAAQQPPHGADLQREQRRPGPRGAAARSNRYRNAQERSAGRAAPPRPGRALPDRDLRRFRAEAHQRLAAPLNALASRWSAWRWR